jgi:TolA-binding protein
MNETPLLTKGKRKLSQLEAQMEALRNRVPDTTTAATLLELQHQVNQRSQSENRSSQTYSHQFQRQQLRENEYTSPVSMSVSTHSHPSQPHPETAFSQPHLFSQSPRTEYDISALKRKRGGFELNVEGSVDVVAKGLISLADAQMYFGAFFQGCVSSLPSTAPKEVAVWAGADHRKGQIRSCL